MFDAESTRSHTQAVAHRLAVLEQFVAGKHPPQPCEDAIVVTPHFVAVIDGATDESGARFGGLSGGHFAALKVSGAIEGLDPGATAREFADALTLELRHAALTDEAQDLADYRRPCAAVACLSATRSEVWRIGDTHVVIDGQLHSGAKRLDDACYGFRAVIDAALLAKGVSLEELLATDPGAAACRPLFDLQQQLANRTGPWSWGCVNGDPVPEELLEVFELPSGHCEVILTSDGYPEVASTLAESEERLAALLEVDPLAVDILWRMGKALRPGAASPDDRAYVRLRVSPGG